MIKSFDCRRYIHKIAVFRRLKSKKQSADCRFSSYTTDRSAFRRFQLMMRNPVSSQKPLKIHNLFRLVIIQHNSVRLHVVNRFKRLVFGIFTDIQSPYSADNRLSINRIVRGDVWNFYKCHKFILTRLHSKPFYSARCGFTIINRAGAFAQKAAVSA